MVSHQDGTGAVRRSLDAHLAVTPSLLPLSATLSQTLPPSNGGVRERLLSPSQLSAVRSAMRLFIEDDLARGVSSWQRAYCDSCQRPRPAAGSIKYDRYALCNACATEYEVARARGLPLSPGQFVRDKHFGDGDAYTLYD
jgi:hypothetical protein